MDQFISIERFHDEYFNNLGEGDLILDVRTEDEFNESHIPGSYNQTHTEVLEAKQKVEENKRVFILCRKGGRAVVAYNLLIAAGVEASKLICVNDGGMERWLESNYPTL